MPSVRDRQRLDKMSRTKGGHRVPPPTVILGRSFALPCRALCSLAMDSPDDRSPQHQSPGKKDESASLSRFGPLYLFRRHDGRNIGAGLPDPRVRQRRSDEVCGRENPRYVLSFFRHWQRTTFLLRRLQRLSNEVFDQLQISIADGTEDIVSRTRES